MAASPPLPPGSARLLSAMGMRRGRRTGDQIMHAGLDLGHPGGRGTPVLNIQGGVVERVISTDDPRRVGFDGYGNGVVVFHPGVYSTMGAESADDTWALYAHMDRVDVQQGQTVAPGQQLGTMGNSTNGKFPRMGVHLHLELRRRRRSGESPFPGPYARSPERLLNSLYPRPWLEAKGLSFARRGGFEIAPGSAMSQTRAIWENLGLFGVDPYPTSRFLSWRLPETSLAAVGQEAGMDVGTEYEPPARFDRDVYLGLTPLEWAAAGAGALVLTGTVVALVVRRQMSRNRRRGAPRRSGRRRTSRARLRG